MLYKKRKNDDNLCQKIFINAVKRNYELIIVKNDKIYSNWMAL